MPNRFDMLLGVEILVRTNGRGWAWKSLRIGAPALAIALGIVSVSFSSQTPSQTPTPASQQAAPQTQPQAAPVPTPGAPPKAGLNIVVLDPAHGGTDPGARGTGGMRESDIVLDFAAQAKKALEAQGFQVLQTRQGDDNPSFDDRSAMANAQTGAVFVTLHIASTGLPGTVRVYDYSALVPPSDAGGLVPWGKAQAPFGLLSQKLGDMVQAQLAQRFKGSPVAAESAAVRQLRTTAAPAIAVEISSVVVEDRSALDQMAPGVADAIAMGIAQFRPSYVIPTVGGTQ
ncbi:MAG TPA: N-acetylmuramoyl-L-alanine amidase [Candidatus Acidoferrum sp.]|nr:N-acetylmuramoyl-L-alanine amidase [Candidatus Acidoferrum sp.]